MCITLTDLLARKEFDHLMRFFWGEVEVVEINNKNFT